MKDHKLKVYNVAALFEFDIELASDSPPTHQEYADYKDEVLQNFLITLGLWIKEYEHGFSVGGSHYSAKIPHCQVK